jgi:hypothetical protein
MAATGSAAVSGGCAIAPAEQRWRGGGVVAAHSAVSRRTRPYGEQAPSSTKHGSPSRNYRTRSSRSAARAMMFCDRPTTRGRGARPPDVELSEALGICRHRGTLTAIGGDAELCRAIEIADAPATFDCLPECQYNFAVHFRGERRRGDVIRPPSPSTRPGITNLSYNAAVASFNLETAPQVIDDLETVIARRAGRATRSRVPARGDARRDRAARGEPVGRSTSSSPTGCRRPRAGTGLEAGWSGR